MAKMTIDIRIDQHGDWKNEFHVNGEYEDISEEIRTFYEIVKLNMDKAIEKERVYQSNKKQEIEVIKNGKKNTRTESTSKQ